MFHFLIAYLAIYQVTLSYKASSKLIAISCSFYNFDTLKWVLNKLFSNQIKHLFDERKTFQSMYTIRFAMQELVKVGAWDNLILQVVLFSKSLDELLWHGLIVLCTNIWMCCLFPMEMKLNRNMIERRIKNTRS